MPEIKLTNNSVHTLKAIDIGLFSAMALDKLTVIGIAQTSGNQYAIPLAP